MENIRVLSLDVGKKKIGIAISDALGITAQPCDTLIRKSKRDVFEQLERIVFNMHVSKIVVGLPLNMNGTEGPMAKATYDFVKELKENVKVPVELWDERLTTMEAERVLLQADLSRKKRKRLNDQVAAQLILQSYLDKNVQI